MKVLKFGGSSVANHQNIKKVLHIVKQSSKQEKTVVVVSAFGKTTDKLLATAQLALKDNILNSKAVSELEALHFSVINFRRKSISSNT